MMIVIIIIINMIITVRIITAMLIISAGFTPSPPTKSFPITSPRVELSGRLPIELYGHENSHPFKLRVCLSQTL